MNIHSESEPVMLLPDMLCALDDEIEEVKKIGRKNYRIYDGQCIRKQRQFSVYQFHTDARIEVPDDTPIALQYKKATIRGSLISSTEFDVVIEIEKYIGQSIERATLICSPEYLLIELKKRLESLKNSLNQKADDYPLLHLLFGSRVPQPGKADPVFTPNTFTKRMNASQKKAIACALGSDLTFIWGPPGTGKTTTLGLLIDALMNQNLRVLVAAHTNVATDRAALAILKASEETCRQEQLKIIRYGPIAIHQPDEERLLKPITIDGIPEYLDEIGNDLKQKISQWRAFKRDLNKIIRIYNETDSLEKNIDNYHNIIEKLPSQINTLVNEIEMCTRQLQQTENEFRALQKRNLFLRARYYFKFRYLRRKRQETHQRLSKLKLRLNQYESRFKQALKEIDPLILAYEEKQMLLLTLFRKFCEKFPHENKNTTPSLTSERLDQMRIIIEQQLKQLNKRRKKVLNLKRLSPEKYVERAQVVITTLSKSFLRDEIAQQSFDVLVVDESSMAPLPSLFFTTSLAKKKVIVIGDPYQLPPIALAKTEPAQKWLERDIYTFKNIRSLDDHPAVHILRYQYRMHPDISIISNTLVYQGLIRDKTSMKKIHWAQKNLGVVSKIDTRELNPKAFWNKHYSRLNLLHAILTVGICKALAENHDPPDEVGIISPYRAQARLIRKLLTDFGFEEAVASTIHKFQGNERDIIILDFVDSNPLPRIGKLLQGGKLDKGGKILNVAITRARKALLLLGNFDYIRHTPKNSFLYQLLSFIHENHHGTSFHPAGNIISLVNHRQEDSLLFLGENPRFVSIFPSSHLLDTLKDTLGDDVNRLVLMINTNPFEPILKTTYRALRSVRPKIRKIEVIKKKGIYLPKKYEWIRKNPRDYTPTVKPTPPNMILLNQDRLFLHNFMRANRKNYSILFHKTPNTIEELLTIFGLMEALRRARKDPRNFLNGHMIKDVCSKCCKTTNFRILIGPKQPFKKCTRCSEIAFFEPKELDDLLPRKYRICPNGHLMVTRKSWRGRNKGTMFLGCSKYPECTYTLPLSRNR